MFETLLLLAAINYDVEVVRASAVKAYDVVVERAESLKAAPPVDVSQFACKIRTTNGMGSGVVTSRGVVTCLHVVNGQSSIEVTFGNETAKGLIVASDSKNDLAVLAVVWKERRPTAELSVPGVKIGDSLKSAGRCKDGTITIEDHSCVLIPPGEILFTNPSNAGRSGAGLFNASGKLVGIVSGNIVSVEPYTGIAIGDTPLRSLIGETVEMTCYTAKGPQGRTWCVFCNWYHTANGIGNRRTAINYVQVDGDTSPEVQEPDGTKRKCWLPCTVWVGADGPRYLEGFHTLDQLWERYQRPGNHPEVKP